MDVWLLEIAGATLVDIFRRKINSSGKLAITHSHNTLQLLIYFNKRTSFVLHTPHYQHITIGSMSWFGQGLSYTNYDY